MPKPWKTTGRHDVLTGTSTARKRKEWEKERDRGIAVKMHLQGSTQAQIAEFLNARENVKYKISRKQVSHDIKTARDIARDLEGSGDATAHLANAILKLEAVEQEAWAAWFRSWEPKERQVEKHGTTGLGASYEEVTKLKEGRVGDKRFLDVILRCIEDASRLRGLYAMKIQVESTSVVHHKAYINVSPAQWDALPPPDVKVIDQGQECLESGRDPNGST